MSRARLALTVTLAVLVVAAGVLAWTLRPQPAPTAVRPVVSSDGLYRVGTVPDRDAVRAAVAALPLALSYDYKSPERTLAAATSKMTPDFADEFRATFDATVRPLALKEKAVTQAQVRAAGVVSRSGNRVTCLVYVDQVLVSSTDLASGKKPVKVGQNRVLVKLLRVGHSWKVDDISPM